MKRKITVGFIILSVVLVTGGFYLMGVMDGKSGKGLSLVNKAEAAGGMIKDPNTVAPDRYVYHPHFILCQRLGARVIDVAVGGDCVGALDHAARRLGFFNQRWPLPALVVEPAGSVYRRQHACGSEANGYKHYLSSPYTRVELEPSQH